MRYKIGVAVIVAIAVAVASAPALSDAIGKTDDEVRAIAEPIIDSILDGMKTGDYAKFSKDFDDTMKEALTKEKFASTNQQLRSQMGNYKSREYIGFLNKGKMTIVMWKGKFDGTEDDILIKLVLSKRGDKNYVTGLWFQ